MGFGVWGLGVGDLGWVEVFGCGGLYGARGDGLKMRFPKVRHVLAENFRRRCRTDALLVRLGRVLAPSLDCL